MKDKPIIFNIYAILFLLIAISIPIQISLLYGHRTGEMHAIYNKLTFLNLVVVGSSLANFYYCLTASENIKWSFPLAVGVICLNNAMVLIYGNDFSSFLVISSTLMFLVVSSYFVLSHDTDILNAPEKQWWRIPKRFHLKEHVAIGIGEEIVDFGETFDISTTGAFIPLDDEMKKKVVDGKIYTFQIGSQSPITCKAKIIRKTDARGNYPEGIGIQFVDLNITEKYKLQHKLFQTKLGLAVH